MRQTHKPSKEIKKLADHYFELQCKRLGPLTRIGKPSPQLKALTAAQRPVRGSKRTSKQECRA
jgi:hypothetical protein